MVLSKRNIIIVIIIICISVLFVFFWNLNKYNKFYSSELTGIIEEIESNLSDLSTKQFRKLQFL